MPSYTYRFIAAKTADLWRRTRAVGEDDSRYLDLLDEIEAALERADKSKGHVRKVAPGRPKGSKNRVRLPMGDDGLPVHHQTKTTLHPSVLRDVEPVRRANGDTWYQTNMMGGVWIQPPGGAKGRLMLIPSAMAYRNPFTPKYDPERDEGKA